MLDRFSTLFIYKISPWAIIMSIYVICFTRNYKLSNNLMNLLGVIKRLPKITRHNFVKELGS